MGSPDYVDRRGSITSHLFSRNRQMDFAPIDADRDYIHRLEIGGPRLGNAAGRTAIVPGAMMLRSAISYRRRAATERRRVRKNPKINFVKRNSARCSSGASEERGTAQFLFPVRWGRGERKLSARVKQPEAPGLS